MIKKEFSWPDFLRVPIIGIVRNLSFEVIEKILPVYIASGLTTLEITMNTPAAGEIIRYARDKFAGRLNIGAGTVSNEKDLEKAMDAGSQFIVTPILNLNVIRECVRSGVPVFPGAFTPTEIYQAWENGASMVKVYPATSLGPDYIKDVKAPLNQIKLLPTGGIGLDNMSAFMKAGSDGLGIGGQLFDKQLIKTQNWSALETHFKQYSAYFTSENK